MHKLRLNLQIKPKTSTYVTYESGKYRLRLDSEVSPVRDHVMDHVIIQYGRRLNKSLNLKWACLRALKQG